MKLTILILCISLSGCGLSYETTEQLVKYCTTRNMEVVYVRYYSYVMGVRCRDTQGNMYDARRMP